MDKAEPGNARLRLSLIIGHVSKGDSWPTPSANTRRKAANATRCATASQTARPRDARTPVGDVSAYPVPPVGHRVLHQPVRQDQSFSRTHQKAFVAFDYRPPVAALIRGRGEPDLHSASFQVRLLSKTRCRWVSSESRYASQWAASKASCSTSLPDPAMMSIISSSYSSYACSTSSGRIPSTYTGPSVALRTTT